MARVPIVPVWTWPALLPLALAMLFYASRGAPLGVAVADDYAFLGRLAFQHPLDPFDSMGAVFYWRPVGRQLAFSLMGPLLIAHPWAPVMFHATLLLGLAAILYGAARRALPPAAAAAVAAFPLVSEPARVLLAWPSGVQHLLAAIAAALALSEAMAGRMASSGIAALIGLLSQETAVLVLPLLPAIAWLRTHGRKPTLAWATLAVGIGAAWAAGYAIAHHHGVRLPPGVKGGYPFARLPEVFRHALTAAFNLEDVAPAISSALVPMLIVAFAAAAIGVARRRERVRRVAPAIGLGLAWFALGILPLAILLPDWNAWRAFTPTLGLGIAATVFLGAVSPTLAVAFVGIRLLGLIAAPLAPTVVSLIPPPTESAFSFPRTTRLQRIIESTRRALARDRPTVPRGASLRYWNIPRMAEVAFQDSIAPRVWYRDSTLRWGTYGGQAGLQRHNDLLVEYFDNTPWPAAVVEPQAFEAFEHGALALTHFDLVRADSLFARAQANRTLQKGPFLAVTIANRARIALAQGNHARADSLVTKSIELNDRDPDTWAFAAAVAYIRGDRARAVVGLRQCFGFNPNNAEGRRVAEALGIKMP